MRWEDAPYVKLYRDNGPWMDLSLEARGLFAELLKVVDRAGLLKLGADPAKTIARAVNGEPDRVRGYLDDLTRDGCVTVRDNVLVIRNYVSAQSARASDKARQAESRARASALALATTDQSDSTQNSHASVTHESRVESEMHEVVTTRLEETRREERERPRPRKAQASIWQAQAEELWREFNFARMATITGVAHLQPTAGNLKHLIDRLASGESQDTIRHVIAVYAAEVRKGGDPKHFNAITPFRPDNFARAASQPKPSGGTNESKPSNATERQLEREAVERGFKTHAERLSAEGCA